MQQLSDKVNNLSFLEGGGEMGELISNFDWESTPLGNIEQWSLSLKITLGIILKSGFPMFLFWGKEQICFYNDAFRPSLGIDGKHPMIGKHGKEGWAEIWNFVGPLIETVMTTGKAVWFQDQLVPFYRNGKMEDIYWTFSYSAVNGDNGEIEGVFVTCTETTEKFKATEELQKSKNQLQFAIDAAELGTWELDPTSNKFTGNNRLKEWFGLLPEDEIDLADALNLIAAEDKNKVSEAINYALKEESGGHYDVEYSIIHPKTEEETIVKAKGKAYFNELGKIYTFSGILQDVSQEVIIRRQLAIELEEQKIIRKKIEDNEAHLQLLRDAVPAMIFYVDANQRYQSYNVVFMEWFGVNATEIIGKTVLEFLGQEAYERVYPFLCRAFAGEQAKYEMLAPTRMKEERWLSIVYTPHFTRNGIVIGVIVHATDITAQILTRRKIEMAVDMRTKELAESNQNLLRSNSELEQFAYIASHDLQEPLRKISTFVKMLEGSIDNVNEKTKKYINIIYKSADRMTKLVRDVLAFSQLTQNNENNELVDLKNIMESVMADFELLIQKKHAVIEIKNLPVVKAAPSQMTQLFSNLLSNSLKYSREGEVPVITISSKIADIDKVETIPVLDPSELYYHIQFQDNGIGFESEQVERIFKIFQRLHGKSEFEGMGIGLSICRKIVEAHNGHISAAVVHEGGALFNIFLPYQVKRKENSQKNKDFAINQP